MSRARISGPQKTVEFARGLFVLNYSAADDTAAPPIVRVEPRGEDVEVICHPDAEDAILRHPGSALVIRALSAGALLVEVLPSRPNGSVAVSLKVEPLEAVQLPAESVLQVPAPSRTASSRAKPGVATPVAAPKGLRVLGHVAGRGDVVVDAGTWLAGPSSPSRIEGIALDWADIPPGLQIRYVAMIGGARGGTSVPTDLGNFVGTRGQAAPLTGLQIELGGPDAARYNLIGEALFLGAPVVRSSGRRLNLSGLSGREPLVGLKLQVEPMAVMRRPHREAAIAAPLAEIVPAATRAAPVVQRSGRVRVFRSSPASSSLAG